MSKPGDRKVRNYELGGLRKNLCITECDKTGKNVGSADCEKNCKYYAGRDDAKQFVICWEI